MSLISTIQILHFLEIWQIIQKNFPKQFFMMAKNIFYRNATKLYFWAIQKIMAIVINKNYLKIAKLPSGICKIFQFHIFTKIFLKNQFI